MIVIFQSAIIVPKIPRPNSIILPKRDTRFLPTVPLSGTNSRPLTAPKRPPFWFLISPPAKSRPLSRLMAKGITMMVTASTGKMWHHRRNSAVPGGYLMFLEGMIRHRINIPRRQSLTDEGQLQARHFLPWRLVHRFQPTNYPLYRIPSPLIRG